MCFVVANQCMFSTKQRVSVLFATTTKQREYVMDPSVASHEMCVGTSVARHQFLELAYKDIQIMED